MADANTEKLEEEYMLAAKDLGFISYNMALNREKIIDDKFSKTPHL